MGMREEIIEYMSNSKLSCRGWFHTWRFRFHMPYETKQIRRELEKMEREGLVTSDHDQSNNTGWALVVTINTTTVNGSDASCK